MSHIVQKLLRGISGGIDVSVQLVDGSRDILVYDLGDLGQDVVRLVYRVAGINDCLLDIVQARVDFLDRCFGLFQRSFGCRQAIRRNRQCIIDGPAYSVYYIATDGNPDDAQDHAYSAND